MNTQPHSILIGSGSNIHATTTELGDRITIGDNTSIECNRLAIEDSVAIGNNVIIRSDEVVIGFNSFIGDRRRIISGATRTDEQSTGPRVFQCGDNNFLGEDSWIVAPSFISRDYVSLNNHLLVNGISPCTIGHNVWVGQNCILNAMGRLTIGNGVGIGTYSNIWTHSGHGELLEGCRIFKIAPVTLEDYAWLLGSFNTVAPGVTIERAAIVLTGSVVTRNITLNA